MMAMIRLQLALLWMGVVEASGSGSQWWPFGGGGGPPDHSALFSPGNIGCPLPRSQAQQQRFDHRADPRRLRLATFNAEWLFDGVDDGRMVPWATAGEAAEHTSRVGDVVGALDADIVVLTELEGCFMLHRLLQGLPAAAGNYTPLVVAGKDSATRQQLGLITRLSPLGPLRTTPDRRDYPQRGSGCGFTGKPKTSGVSKHLLGVFAVPGLDRELLVVGAHLKARPNEPRSCAQREAQAAVLAALIKREALEHSPPRHAILLGDLNDFDSLLPDASGNKPRSSVLRQLSADIGMHSAASRLAEAERWTWSGERYPKAALDHILLSEGLWPLLEGVTVGGAGGVVAEGASDHRPLLVELRLPGLEFTSRRTLERPDATTREL